MNKETRKKQLEQLAHSSQGEALRDYFNELIDKMIDARNYDKSNFESDGRASVKAAEVLGKIIKTLNILEKSGQAKDHKDYI